MNRLKLFFISYKFELLCFFIFFILYLPLSKNITFYQNDDWYYYKQVELFLQGKFRLLNDLGATYYLQGFIGSIFSLFFGVGSLAMLTLIISALSVFIFLLILRVNKVKTPLIVLSFFVLISFPVFSYSTLGFMTENYFLFFVLCSLLFFNLYIKSKNKYLYLLLSIFFTICSFFIKQNILALLLIYSFFALIKKDYKGFIISVSSTIFLYLFYVFLFPQTPYMRASSFSVLGFLPQNVTFVFYTTLAYILILISPLFAFFKVNFVFSLSKKFFLNFVIFVSLFSFLVSLFLLYSSFKIHPYFGNTFAHLGYLYGSIEGEKPVARLMARFFILYTQIAPILISIFTFYCFLNFKKIIKNRVAFFYLISFILFHLSSLVLLRYFDRYLIIPFVLFLLFAINLLKSSRFNFKIGLLVFPFLVINFYISYLFAWDFVLTNRYVWERSKELVKNENVLPELVYGNGAWIEKYNVKKIENCVYVFNYDFPLKSNIDTKFVLIEKREFNELKPFYKNSAIYLYRNTSL